MEENGQYPLVFTEEANENFGIPRVCQYGAMSSKDFHSTEDEIIGWLTERNAKLPLWSRLYTYNCMGYARGVPLAKENNYDIEIPNRLLSLFGTIMKISNVEKVKNEEFVPKIDFLQLTSITLAMCSVLKYDSKQWSKDSLDTITQATATKYREIKQTLSVTDKKLKLDHFANLRYDFIGSGFIIRMNQVATGYVYIPYGWDEFNLARVLSWFFRYYQFGVIECCNRLLAFGFTLDSEYGFFMYDCSCTGYPLFEENHTTPYILRMNHLQVLLYCIVMTLNITSQNILFKIHNCDVTIVDPEERVTLIQEKYVPTIVNEKLKKLDDSELVAEINGNTTSNETLINSYTYDSNNINNNTKNINAINSIPRDSYISLSAEPINKANNFTPQAPLNKLTLDADKMYYLIGIPKNSKPVLENSDNVKVNIHRVKTSKLNGKEGNQTSDKVKQECYSETIYLNNSASATTLIPMTFEPTVSKQSSTSTSSSGLKVYLINNNANLDPAESNNKIQMAYELRKLLSERLNFV